MSSSSLRQSWRLFLFFLLGLASADVSTTVISVTSTKTVHATNTNYAGACDDFVGACVVYGTYANAPYTTTVYRGRSSDTTSLTTSTTTLVATTTASNSGACSGFVGACVVYATNSGSAASASSTVYYQSSNNHNGLGNNQGYIAQGSNGGGNGYIGSGASGRDCSQIGVLVSLILVMGLGVWI